jgi:hypothetical protein
MNRERAQLVLAAAAVVAVALAPVVVAYLQLGYHDDVRASGDYTAPAENAQRMLERAVHESAAGIPSEYEWSERGDAVEEVRERLGPRLAELEASRVEEGTAYQVAYNESAAAEWASSNCPGGPNRQFGGCETVDGVVVQDRVGETHMVAVAFDLRVTTERGWIRGTVVVRVL